MNAETAYLFRHALLRDAAYDLHLPEGRARLHLLAADVLEALPGAETVLAREIAVHLRLAGSESAGASQRAREVRFTKLAAEHADSNYKPREAVELWQRAGDLSVTGKADMLRRAGRSALQAGMPSAEALLRQSLQFATTEGDVQSEAFACGSIANLYQQTGRVDEALAFHERAIEIARGIGTREFEGVQVGNIANLYFRQGRLEAAEAAHQRALEIHRQAGSRGNEAVSLGNLAGVLQKLGRNEEAEAHFKQSISLLQQVGDLRSYAIAMSNYGNFLADTGRMEESEGMLVQALSLVRESGNRRFEGNVLGSLGLLHSLTGRVRTGVGLLAQACAIHEEVQNWANLVRHGLNLALGEVSLGDTGAALTRWRHAADHARRYGYHSIVDEILPDMQQACAMAGVPPPDSGP
ncbi:MAG: tetratricopeptide repeat protein [Planctomycetes bacterium]|nr:tetratricopeptide repeat protein [Planctomycetota bacterium]